MSGNDLLERYVNEVGRHLPRRQRRDIQTEIYSLLNDSLERRLEHVSGGELAEVEEAGVKEAGVEEAAIEEAVRALLHEFGPPEKYAERYRRERYLIGPALFGPFILVLTIVLAVVAGLHLLGILAGLLLDGDFTLTLTGIVETLTRLGEHLLVNAGLVVLVFALIEYFQGGKETAGETEEWDLAELPAVENRDRISRTGLSLSIAWHLIVFVFLTFFPHWIGAINITDEGVTFTVLLAPEFHRFLPWLASLLLVEAGLYVIVLHQGEWVTSTRWSPAAVNLLWVVLLIVIITGGAITTIGILTATIKLALGIIVIISIIELAGQFWRLVTSPPGSTWQPDENGLSR